VLRIKVLFVHNYYQEAGGEDRVVEQEIQLLKQNGIKVASYFTDNKNIKIDGIYNKVRLGLNTIWSFKEYRNIKKKITIERPDVVHFHNTFPLLSPSVYYAAKDLGIPVVQTLHNYRLACPNALFLRNGLICEKCVSGSLFYSIKYACYRNSRLQTIPLSAMLLTHRALKTWNKKVDKYIALTKFAKDKFVENGINANKITVKPNYIDKKFKSKISKNHKNNNILFVGRISKEKGLDILLEAWVQVKNKKNGLLEIIGDGPLKQEFEQKYKEYSDIKFYGKLDNEIVLNYISNAKYIVVPSICFEGFPMTIVEAYSVGTPVISSNIGSLKEIVNNEVTGFHFKNNNVSSLVSVLSKALLFSNYSTLVENVKNQFEMSYTSDYNFRKLIEIYEEVIRKRNNND
jgi:glycosyltransferase involved in cell wall biosynthesis